MVVVAAAAAAAGKDWSAETGWSEVVGAGTGTGSVAEA